MGGTVKDVRICAGCHNPHDKYSAWWFSRDKQGDVRALCHPCCRIGFAFADDGTVVLTRTVDGGTRRAVAGLMRGSVGTRKGDVTW